MSGDDTYQLVLTHCISQTADMVSKGLLIDWNDIDTVDLTREYWNQHCNDGLTVYGKQYYAVNDFMIPDPNAIIFNKEMMKIIVSTTLTNSSMTVPGRLIKCLR